MVAQEARNSPSPPAGAEGAAAAQGLAPSTGTQLEEHPS